MIPGVEFSAAGTAILREDARGRVEIVLADNCDGTYDLHDVRVLNGEYCTEYDRRSMDLATACCVVYALLNPDEVKAHDDLG